MSRHWSFRIVRTERLDTLHTKLATESIVDQDELRTQHRRCCSAGHTAALHHARGLLTKTYQLGRRNNDGELMSLCLTFSQESGVTGMTGIMHLITIYDGYAFHHLALGQSIPDSISLSPWRWSRGSIDDWVC